MGGRDRSQIGQRSVRLFHARRRSAGNSFRTAPDRAVDGARSIERGLIHIKSPASAESRMSTVSVGDGSSTEVQAIRIIQDEHRALAAVLHGMLHVVREIRYFDVTTNFELLRAMTHYIQAFPERFHHPKEEAYLFKQLRMRHPDSAPLLDRLESEHRSGALQIEALCNALATYERDGPSAFAPYAGAVAAYAAAHWDHAGIEETKVVPLARRYLTPEDWGMIDAAFTSHTDPLVGIAAGAQYKELFRT